MYSSPSLIRPLSPKRVAFDERGLIRGGLLYIDFSPERRP
jgi:hypothetical protein